MTMKTLTYSIVAVAMAGALLGQDADKKAGAKSAGATLHPEMTVAPEAGSFEKPMATLGDKPSETWTKTTVDRFSRGGRTPS